MLYLIYLFVSCWCTLATFGRLGLVVPNTFESHPLVCPEDTTWECDTPGAFVSTKNHKEHNIQITLVL